MWLIYGATGTTARILLRVWDKHFRHLPPPLLTGRRASVLASLSRKYGLSYQAFSLEEINRQTFPAELRLVVNLAGPYVETARPWVEACQKRGLACMDICGEWQVFKWLYGLSGISVPIITGAGYDTVVGEAALYFFRQRFPEARRLELGIYAKGGFSSGTIKSALGMLPAGSLRWEKGRLISIPPLTSEWSIRKDRAYTFASAPLAELVTFPAWNPDLESLSTWVVVPPTFLRWRPFIEKVFRVSLFRGMARVLLDWQRERFARQMEWEARSYAFVRDRQHQIAVATPQPYIVTAWTVLRSVELFLEKGAEAGTHSAFARWRERLWQGIPQTHLLESGQIC